MTPPHCATISSHSSVPTLSIHLLSSMRLLIPGRVSPSFEIPLKRQSPDLYLRKGDGVVPAGQGVEGKLGLPGPLGKPFVPVAFARLVVEEHLTPVLQLIYPVELCPYRETPNRYLLRLFRILDGEGAPFPPLS